MKTSDTIKKILKEIDLKLIADGFKRKGYVFFKNENQFLYIIWIQKSRHGDQQEDNITVNLQVYWDELRQVRGFDASEVPEITPGAGEIVNLGRLRPANINQYGNAQCNSWDIDETTNPIDVSEEIVRDLRKYAYSWFEKCSTKSHVIEYLDGFIKILKNKPEYRSDVVKLAALKNSYN